jgi:hypothetical protein
VGEKGGQNDEERFWKEMVMSEVFDPFLIAHVAGFVAFLRDKVTPVAGVVVQPFCGLDAGLREDLVAVGSRAMSPTRCRPSVARRH